MHVKPLFWNIWPNYIAANDHDDAKSMDTMHQQLLPKNNTVLFFYYTDDCWLPQTGLCCWHLVWSLSLYVLISLILHVAKQKIGWLENCNEVWESCLTDCPLWHLDCELILSEEGFVWNSGCKENCHWQAN